MFKDNVHHQNTLEDQVEIEPIYNYNFISIPWDDRTCESKLGIIVLLTAIFLATMGCVTNNLLMHYRKFEQGKFLV